MGDDRERAVRPVGMRFPRPGREIRVLGGAARFRDKDILDIGTGNGRLVFDVARYAHRVVGIDPNEEALRSARQRAGSLGLRNVRFCPGNATTLDLGRERFDIAIFSWSL